ncbi:MAG: sigma-54-dependent Fis family transcriptional regulator [Acidobacteria bacterium]|nr:sigma-54-dependent Fis family transcriptional regulator [Acidobacteriota bacterium]
MAATSGVVHRQVEGYRRPAGGDEPEVTSNRHFQFGGENGYLSQAIKFSPSQSGFVGESPVAREILGLAQKLSALHSTVLITGESGVGKGLVARMIHSGGPRAEQPFVTVSCTGLPSELVESELFGHEKGAFTGAYEKRVGRVEIADQGTLFLDEVGDLPLDLQPKLLNFLQERTFTRLGSNKTISVDVRVIAATNQDLKGLCREKRFREDLYFRLNVLLLHIPALRSRKEDIPSLVDYILTRISQYRRCKSFLVAEDAFEALLRYDWPGNVRELENILERSTAFCSDFTIRYNDVPSEILNHAAPDIAEANSLDGLSLAEITQMAILRTLDLCGGNKSQAARRLGISEKTIYNKIRELRSSDRNGALLHGNALENLFQKKTERVAVR